MKKIDKINLSLNIFNLVLVILTIITGYMAIISNENIAKKSGAFDKGEFDLTFGGYSIIPNKEYDVFYGVEISDSIINFSTLPINIHNVGQKTLEEVNLLIQYPSSANISMSDSLLKFEAPFIEKFERKFRTVDPYDQVFYKLNSINPNYPINAGDLIAVQEETITSATIPAMTKDSIEINFKTRVTYAIPVQIAISAKDTEREQYNLRLNYRKETDLTKLILDIVEEKLKMKDEKNFIPNFFVTIPKTSQLIEKNGIRINFLNSDATNTLFCQFDESLETLAVFNQNGQIQNYIPVK